MTELVIVVSTGKGTWAEAAKIISAGEWEKIFIITNDFGRENFSKKENMELIVVNANDDLPVLIEKIRKGMSGKISGTDVAFNMVSGSGKEHMAVLSALLKLGVGIRLVSYVNDSLKEI